MIFASIWRDDSFVISMSASISLCWHRLKFIECMCCTSSFWRCFWIRDIFPLFLLHSFRNSLSRKIYNINGFNIKRWLNEKISFQTTRILRRYGMIRRHCSKQRKSKKNDEWNSFIRYLVAFFIPHNVTYHVHRWSWVDAGTPHLFNILPSSLVYTSIHFAMFTTRLQVKVERQANSSLHFKFPIFFLLLLAVSNVFAHIFLVSIFYFFIFIKPRLTSYQFD